MVDLSYFGFVTVRRRWVALFPVAVCIIALLSALIAEHVFGLLPCKLCYTQRWAFVVALAFGVFGYGVRDSDRAFALLLLCVGAAFAYGAYIAGYQAGGEYGWWALSSDCASRLDGNLSTEEFLAAIKSAPTVPCDVAAWSLFGISMAGYNVLLSGGMAIWSALTSFIVFNRR